MTAESFVEEEKHAAAGRAGGQPSLLERLTQRRDRLPGLDHRLLVLAFLVELHRLITTLPGFVDRGEPLRALATLLLQALSDHVRVGLEPIGHPDEGAALHLPDLHPAAALVVLGGDLDRRNEAAEREVLDVLEPGLHVGTGDRSVGFGAQRVADGLHGQRRLQHSAVVVDDAIAAGGSWPRLRYISRISLRTE